MAVKKITTLESLWSLWNLIRDLLAQYGLLSSVLAMLTLIGAAIYSVTDWVSQYGWAGWVLAAAASVAIVAILIGLVFAAWSQIETVRAKRMAGHKLESSQPQPSAVSVSLTDLSQSLQALGRFEARIEDVVKEVASKGERYELLLRTNTIAMNEVAEGFKSMRTLTRAIALFENAREIGATFEIFDSSHQLRAEVDWEKWSERYQQLRRAIKRYSEEVLRGNASRNLEAVDAVFYSPDRWPYDPSTFPDRQKEHEYKTAQIMLENLRSTHYAVTRELAERAIPNRLRDY